MARISRPSLRILSRSFSTSAASRAVRLLRQGEEIRYGLLDVLGEKDERAVQGLHDRDPLLPAGELAGELAAAQDGADARQDFGEIERLGDIVIDALLEALDPVLHLVHGGKHDDGGVPITAILGVLLEHPRHFPPGELRHDVVQDDQVGIARLHLLQGLFPVHGLLHLETELAEHDVEELEIDGLVVDDEYLCL